MKTLIIVDIQNDFLPGGALEVPHGDQIVPLINDLQGAFDLVVATQDYHPYNHGSFAVNHPGHVMYEVVDLNGLPQVLWPVHCVQGEQGSEFAQELNMEKVAEVFPKGTDMGIDSYSGFFDNGRKKSTGLGEYLEEKGSSKVYVCGLATDFCVKATAMDAASLGFETYLISDACKGVELQEGDIAKAIREMEEAGVKQVHSSEILRVAESLESLAQ